jgi:hypothetical protein
MRLTSKKVQEIREMKKKCQQRFGKQLGCATCKALQLCKWLDDMCDTIEALQQENAELKHALMVDLKTGTIRELELLQGKAVLVLPDMPEGCAECWILSQNDLGYACAFLHKLIKYETLKQGKRRGDCPLRIVGGASGVDG